MAKTVRREMREEEINALLNLTNEKISEDVKTRTEKVIESNFGKEMVNIILSANSIFGMGKGQVELVLKAFIMRLMQMGFTSYVVGETITPAITKNDCLIVVTHFGEEPDIISGIKIMKETGASVIVVTSKANSTVAKLADILIMVPDNTDNEDVNKLVPLETLFGETLLRILDSIAVVIKEATGQSEEDMGKRQANI